MSDSARPWTRHYVAPTRAEIPRSPLANLPALIRKSSQTYGQQLAFTTMLPNGMNGSLSYRQVDQDSDAFAAYLREDCGLKAGDRVAVQMPNCLAYPVVAMGVLKAGCVLVNTNPLYTSNEMLHQFRDSQIRALVIIDMFADRLTPVLAQLKIEHVIVNRLDHGFPWLVGGIVRLIQKYWNLQLPKIPYPHVRLAQALERGHKKAIESPARTLAYAEGLNHDSLALLQYTGGTTGVSKAAMLTHGNILCNIDQILEMVGAKIENGKETVLAALPLYHIFAFTVNLFGFFQIGARSILIPSPRPLSNLRRAFENYPITWLPGVNTLFNGLLNETWFKEFPPDKLKASVAGGMALHKAVAERWEATTRTPIVEGYGLTEASPVLSFNPLGGLVKRESIGIPMPSTEIRCCDDQGQPIPIGQPGELWARGPQVMKGYWQREDETKKVLRDGWLATGDIAIQDEDGFFKIVDRKKDMILVSGFNVFPNEVEDVIARIEGVLEVAVIGVPDGENGEAVKAFIVKDDNAQNHSQLNPEGIREHCGKYLTRYKIPKMIEFRESLPKTPVGKILRKDLRQEQQQALTLSTGQQGAR